MLNDSSLWLPLLLLIFTINNSLVTGAVATYISNFITASVGLAMMSKAACASIAVSTSVISTPTLIISSKISSKTIMIPSPTIAIKNQTQITIIRRLLGANARRCRPGLGCRGGQECYRGQGCVYPDIQSPNNLLLQFLRNESTARSGESTVQVDQQCLRILRRSRLTGAVALQAFSPQPLIELTSASWTDSRSGNHCRETRFNLRSSVRGSDGLQAVVYSDTKNETAIVGWQGTSSLWQWLRINLKFHLVSCQLTPGLDCGRVAKGFQQAFLNMRDEMYRQLGNYYHRVVFTGHSLGGALATMAALWFAHNHTSLPRKQSSSGTVVVGLYTSGCPRVGDQRMARLLETLLGIASSGGDSGGADSNNGGENSDARGLSADLQRLVQVSPYQQYIWDKRDLVTLLPPGADYESIGRAVDIPCLTRNNCNSIGQLHSLQNYLASIDALWEKIVVNGNHSVGDVEICEKW